MSSSVNEVLARLGSQVNHIGFVAEDLDGMVRRQEQLLGVEFTAVRMTDVLPIVRPTIGATTVQIRVAFADFGPLRLEIIEPLPGPSIYRDHLDQFGEGVHHLGFDVSDVVGFVDKYGRVGVGPAMYGRRTIEGPVYFAYFDTRSELGVLTEVVDLQSVNLTNRAPRA